METEEGMTKIFVFGKQGCAKCDTTKNKLRHFLTQWELDHNVSLTFHDLDTLDGRAEGAFHDVRDIPLTVIERGGLQVARWDGSVPSSESVRVALNA